MLHRTKPRSTSTDHAITEKTEYAESLNLSSKKQEQKSTYEKENKATGK
jgi:hypothetical protein